MVGGAFDPPQERNASYHCRIIHEHPIRTTEEMDCRWFSYGEISELFYEEGGEKPMFTPRDIHYLKVYLEYGN